MSFDLFNAARRLDLADVSIKGVSRSTAKLVLLVMAGAANPHYFGTMTRLARETGLDRKAVFRATAALADKGLIKDTGTRRGQTRQVVEWEFPGLLTELSTNGAHLGTVPKKEQYPITHETVPNCPINGPQLGIRILRSSLTN